MKTPVKNTTPDLNENLTLIINGPILFLHKLSPSAQLVEPAQQPIYILKKSYNPREALNHAGFFFVDILSIYLILFGDQEWFSTIRSDQNELIVTPRLL
jgi:hypothetical protein